MNIHDLTTPKDREKARMQTLTHQFDVVDESGAKLFPGDHLSRSLDPANKTVRYCMRCRGMFDARFARNRLRKISTQAGGLRIEAMVCRACFHLHTACGWDAEEETP